MKTINTEKALQAYSLLNAAKYNKMDDTEKIAVFKITRAIKPIATTFEDASKDAIEKMKFEGFEEQLAKAKEYERKKKEGSEDTPITDDEYKAFIIKLVEYDKLAKEAIKQLGDKEETIDVELLSEDSFAKLMSSNDWTMEQAIVVSEVVCK